MQLSQRRLLERFGDLETRRAQFATRSPQHPRARVLTLIFLIFFVTFIEIPAVVVLGLWFLQQLYFGVADLSDPTGGGVAYFAHIGGFAFGLLTVFLVAKRRPLNPTY